MKRLLVLSLIPLLLSGCSKVPTQHLYGVFLGVDSGDISFMKEYKTVVLDAQYFEKAQIDDLKNVGCTVYSYINIGAIENFRSYYDTYSQYALGDYENWPEEKWMDTSRVEWQNFLINELAPSILSKDIDGFFVDNTDVYYHYVRDEIAEGLVTILNGFKTQGAYILINGGDYFVNGYYETYHNYDILDGVNQETIFSKINWGTNTFGYNSKREREYFQEYVEKVGAANKDIFLLEYTKSKLLTKKIDSYCTKHNYRYYVSKTLELLKP